MHRRLVVMSYGTSHRSRPTRPTDLRIGRHTRPRIGVSWSADCAADVQAVQDRPMSESGGWRSRRWEATHQKIYDAAMRLFQDHGFEQVSVAQIAAEAGVSVPTFYAHYPSKEHVVMQLPTAE